MNMKSKRASRIVAVMLGIVASSIIFAPDASAGCGNTAGSIGAWNARLLSGPNTTAKTSTPAARAFSDDTQPGGADIVGFWAVTFTAKNNPNGPPDGTPLDAGFSQWHSDGTEIMNSSKPPSTGNFCLGVWTKTGRSTYKLTHKVLDYAPNGTLNGPGTIREEVTVDHSGNGFTGQFSIDLYDTSGNLIAHVNGEITGVRITVD